MPTPAEQKALAFLAALLLLGGAVRVVRAGAPPVASAEEQGALLRQSASAESAGAIAQVKKGGRKARLTRSRRDTVTKIIAGVASVPFQDVRPDPSALGTGGMNGFPPPFPRIDVDNRHPAPEPGITARGRGGRPGTSVPPVDIDFASAAQIEALPRVGPALAARIVGNRDSLGAFGSLEALGRVPGIGPATLRALAPQVTFGGRAASSSQRRLYY